MKRVYTKPDIFSEALVNQHILLYKSLDNFTDIGGLDPQGGVTNGNQATKSVDVWGTDN